MPTIITKTIGPYGRDYTTFTAAEAAVSTIGTSSDLVANDEAIVFEVDAGTYTESVTIDSSSPGPALTVDATRNVTYRAASGSEHGGDDSAGVRVVFNTAGNGCFDIIDDFTHIVGLVCTTDTGAVGNRGLIQANGDGILVDGCILKVAHSNPWCLFSNQGGSTSPNVYQNNLLRNANERPIALYSIAAPTSHKFINNTIEGHGDRAIFYQVLGNSMTVEAVNNFTFNVNNWAQGNSSGGSTFTTTGSNNVIDVVGSNMGAGVAILECTTSTNPAEPSTGNQVIYDATTGAMLNVSGNDAVGVGTATGAPTTDINGEDRIRLTHADPGAFTTDLRTITYTVDPAGGADYTTMVSVEGSLVSDMPNPAQRNEALVYEFAAADHDTGSSSFNIQLSVSVEHTPTNNITFRAASGAEHGGDPTAGAKIYAADPTVNASTSYANIDCRFLTIDGMVLGTGRESGSGLLSVLASRNVPGTLRNCLVLANYSLGSTGWDGISEEDFLVENCVFSTTNGYGGLTLSTYGTGGLRAVARNNTVIGLGVADRALVVDGNAAGRDKHVSLYNNIVDNGRVGVTFHSSTNHVSQFFGSNNYAALAAEYVSGSSGQGDLGFNQWTFSTNPADLSTGSLVIYDATTGALVNVPGNDAVGVGTTTGAPTTDINGEDRIRGTFADPGAFVAPLRTIGKTIDAAGGGDYTTFLAAEGAVSTLPTLSDLVERNEAIVFEAVAGTYTENVTIKSSIPGPALTMDATRNITYRPAAGSEHGGSRGAGVKLVSSLIGSNTLAIEDDFTIIDGIEIAFEGLITDDSLASKVTNGAVGVVYKNCLIHANGAREVLRIGQDAAGSAAHPIEVLNCVIDASQTDARPAISSYASTGNDVYTKITNNTLNGHVNQPAINLGSGGANKLHEVTNNISFNRAWSAAGTAVVTGSDNIGPAVAAFPSTLQAEGQAWDFTTDTTATSTGNQVIYDANDFSLINVAGNDAIGVGTATGAPTTDINGEDRIRGAYADPGAFTTELVTINRTIDAAGGGDYTTFTAAEAAVSTLPNDANLVQRNEAIVFEAVAGTYTENVTFDSSNPGPALAKDAIRNVTYQAAAGSEHGGVRGAGVKVDGETLIPEAFNTFRGIELSKSVAGNAVRPSADQGLVFDGVLFSPSTEATTAINTLAPSITRQATPHKFHNCVVFGGIDFYTDCLFELVNCTIYNRLVAAGAGDVTITNCVALGSSTYIESNRTGRTSGSNNIGGNSSSWPSHIQAESQTWTLSTDPLANSTGNQVIYDATTGALLNVPGNDAVGVGTVTGAPTTDINGEDRIRGTFADPGAFTAPLLTLTKSIDGAGGGDYTTFTAAEGEVTTLLPSDNLIERNTAIVFEAEAGTYSGQFTPESTLICDATRNVTYKPAAGSEHGGDKDSGVILTNTGLAMYLRDDFTRVEGLVCKSTSTNNTITTSTQTGWVVDSCIIVDDSATGQSVTAAFTPSPDASNPTVFQNCLVIATGSRGIAAFGIGGYARWSNNTVLHTGNEQTYRVHNTTLTLEAYNNFGVGGNGVNLGTATVTGAGNISGSGVQWPTGISAGNQTWTATTDTAATSTGNQVIYDATTGALFDVPGNDAWNILTDLTNVPASDIVGFVRQASGFNPGAFEESAPVPPGSVTTGTPADEATLVSIEQVLSWAATTDTADYDVAFGTTPNPPVVSSGQAATTYDPGTLSNSTTYYWSVTSNGPGGSTAGTEFSFTTIAAAPGSVTSGTPVDAATLVSIEQVLSWAATTNTADYDVAFGTSPNPPVVSSGQAATTYDPGTLANSTTYYWSVTSNGEGGSTVGTEFSFTTIAAILGQPTDPAPADGDQNVSVDLAILTWTDPVGTIDSYTVYLSHNTNFGPSDIIHQGPSPAPAANHAHYGQQHYWRVDVTNEAGTTEGPIWSFLVEQEPALGPENPVVTPTEYVLTGNLGFADRKSRSRRWDTREGDIRERVFKMTQAQHNISFVYRESLRSMIASFNDIITIDDEQKIKDVKVYHANAERAIAKLSQENNLVLPIISISQTISQDDTDRRRYESVLVHEKYWDEEEHRAKRIVSLAPTAVTINYQINIWCKYMSDMDQIVEQIRLKFNPEMNVPTQQSTLAKAMLGGEDDVGSLVAQDKQDRILQKSFAVSLRTYVENPKFLLTNTGEIERFIIDTDA